MPIAERAGAYPAGVWFDESSEWSAAVDNSLLKYQHAANLAARGWVPLGHTDTTPGWLRPTIDLEVDRIVADIKRASDRYSIKQPAKVVTGISTQQWLDAVENYAMPSRHFIGIDQADFNERSKPMGLSKDHEYTDKDGDIIRAEQDVASGEGTIAYLYADEGFYVDSKSSVPLALNVLGHDRPGILGGFETVVGGQVSSGVVINGQGLRDKTLAIAIANLKSVDRYDQRQAEREAAEDAKKARAEKLTADLETAQKELVDASQGVFDWGVTIIRAEKLADAAAKYKAAYEAHAGS